MGTFIGKIIDELEDEYYLLPNEYNTPKNYGLTHSKTQNYFDYFSDSFMDLTFPKFNIPKIDSFENELDQLDKPITNTMDKTFSDFKIESSMNMNFNNMNTYMGYENKNIFRVKEEKNIVKEEINHQLIIIII